MVAVRRKSQKGDRGRRKIAGKNAQPADPNTIAISQAAAGTVGSR